VSGLRCRVRFERALPFQDDSGAGPWSDRRCSRLIILTLVLIVDVTGNVLVQTMFGSVNCLERMLRTLALARSSTASERGGNNLKSFEACYLRAKAKARIWS